RGEHLVVARVTATIRGFEVELLSLHEVNSARECTYCVLFDPDDLDAALTELDERYIAGEGAEYAEVLRTLVDGARHANADEWDMVRRGLADDLVVIDHQPIGLGEIHGVDEYIRVQRPFRE